jgi:hypothetical protein
MTLDQKPEHPPLRLRPAQVNRAIEKMVEAKLNVNQPGDAHEQEADRVAGQVGNENKSEREFLAFYQEALSPEKPRTGTLHHSMRPTLIDAALGEYYCLKPNKQKYYNHKKQELLDRKAKEIAAGGEPKRPDAPTVCKPSEPR